MARLPMSPTATLVHRILVNDVRLYFRVWQRRGAHRFGGLLLQLMFVAWLHVAMYPIVVRYSEPARLPGGLEFASLFVILLVVIVALQRSLEVLYNRGDLPMMLASPVPMRAVVWTRLIDILITTWLGSALVMVPLLNVAAWLHGPHWLWAWVAWWLAAGAIVPGALLLTVLSVRAVGPRRTRLGVQVGSILLGIIAVVGAQAPNWIGAGDTPNGGLNAPLRFFVHFDQPGLNQLAAAARGDPGGLAVFALVGCVLGAAAFRLLVREFARGVQTTATDLGRSARKTDAARLAQAWRHAFREPRTRAIVHKDFRLVRRDPLLLVRASTQIVSLFPALALVLWDHTATGVAAFAIVGPPVVAVTLATMMTLSDEGHAFVAASPLSPRRAAWARAIAAATLPILFAVFLASGALFLGEPLIALTGAALGGLNAMALAWTGTCTVRPLSAEDRARARHPKILGQYFFAILLGGLGAGSLSALAHELPVVASVLLALAVGGAASTFLLRPRAWAEASV